MAAGQQGFLLTRQWRDSRDGVELEFWLASDQGPVQLLIGKQHPLFFLRIDQCQQAEKLLATIPGCHSKSLPLRDFSATAVKAFYFKQQANLRKARERLRDAGLDPLEADINPQDRFLMERYIRGGIAFEGSSQSLPSYRRYAQPKVTANDYQPRLKVISLDIETAMDDLQLYSIAVYAETAENKLHKVFMVSSEPVAGALTFPDERQLLEAFFYWLGEYDPDIIIGWNVVNFDCWFLQRLCTKHNIDLRLGRGDGKPYWRDLDDDGDRKAITVSGRVVLDGIELLKAASYRFESFSLNAVSSALLDESKLIQGSDRGEKIAELFEHNKPQLAQYNLQDCILVWNIFQKTRLLEFVIARSKLTGLPLDRIGGSVASFDFRYLPHLHRKGYVAPNGHLSEEIQRSPGGFVMDSRPGIYQQVIVLDFKSLYPSIIRSFKIDPLGLVVGLSGDLDQRELVAGFNGAWFSKTETILPEIIAELWQARDAAKRDSNQPLSQAIKIIMNSFYGVLGSAGCRFFDSRLASSITRRGHQIIQQTAAYIEAQGWPVIYGDTDSVFVWINSAESDQQVTQIGKSLEADLNQWWQQRLKKEYAIDCFLEIEFETHYQKFLMPTIRGSEKGSKKRYAGVVRSGQQQRLVFKGLENVRTDWSRLAREFQQELYRRIFFDEPYRDYIKAVVAGLLQGQYDEQLVYRKRLRRKLHEYQRNVPPHVQAARKAVALAGVDIRRGDWIEYVMTVNGAEPVLAQRSMLDYQYYIDRQLAPVADSILYFLEDSLAAVIDRQLAMF